jgi:ribosomal protein S16
MLSELHIKVVAINMGYLRNIRNLSFPTIQTYIPKQTKKKLIKFKLVAVNKKINKGTQSMEDVNAYKVHFNCIDIYVRV